MSIMTERDLECFLCQRHFSAVYVDCILGPEIICDNCLMELGKLEDGELKQRVSAILERRNLFDPALTEFVVQNIRRSRPAPFLIGSK